MPRDTSKYTVAGVRVPSVTECLKLAGFCNFDHIDPSILETARQRGDECHSWLDLLDNGLVSETETPDPHIAGYVAAYLRFKWERGFQPSLIEFTVINADFRYAGTLDRAGTLQGRPRPAVIDIKCVASVDSATGPQTAGYELCLPEAHDRYALQLKRDGSYRLHPLGDRNDRHDFLAAVRVAHYKLRHGLAKLER